ncbi:MAG: sulfatase [Verrucomicrobiae bacterium]|nr:sulfatase [Verrucomicrobiae bacterium]
MLKTLAISLIALACALTTSLSSDRPPNVIVILVDDLGWMDLSCQGSDFYRTPSVDRLATEGMRFTNAYAACAVCSPTRAAVQTGRYPHRVGVTDWIRSLFQRGNLGTPDANPTEYVGSKKQKLLCPPNPYWMESEERTIAEVLDEAGYHTGYIGKWHLGDEPWFPEHQGYEKNKGGCDYGQPPSYFDPFNNPKGKHETIRNGIHNLPGRKQGEYLTHREADEAEAMIREWKDEPFYLQVSHYAVHTPIQAIPEVAAKYEDAPGDHQKNAKYAAMVESVDDSTRQILATLEELRLEKDTLVIFTSDNGGLDNNSNPTDNAPLRSGKGYAYEGGIRVPFIVRWPGVAKAGQVSQVPVISTDLYPTCLAAAGLPPHPAQHRDGLDLRPVLEGGKSLDRDALFWHYPHYNSHPSSVPSSVIRAGDWKLIETFDPEGIELYHLGSDLSETTNLAEREPEKVKELRARLESWRDEVDAEMMEPNPDYDPSAK